MQQFQIENDVLDLMAKCVQPMPFESMSNALRRYFITQQAGNSVTTPRRDRTVEELLAELDALPDRVVETQLPNYARKRRMKTPSPEPSDWIRQIPELRSVAALGSWKSVCEHIGIDTRGDSARRRLREWARTNRPTWPPVPDV